MTVQNYEFMYNNESIYIVYLNSRIYYTTFVFIQIDAIYQYFFVAIVLNNFEETFPNNYKSEQILKGSIIFFTQSILLYRLKTCKNLKYRNPFMENVDDSSNAITLLIVGSLKRQMIAHPSKQIILRLCKKSQVFQIKFHQL